MWPWLTISVSVRVSMEEANPVFKDGHVSGNKDLKSRPVCALVLAKEPESWWSTGEEFRGACY